MRRRGDQPSAADFLQVSSDEQLPREPLNFRSLSSSFFATTELTPAFGGRVTANRGIVLSVARNKCCEPPVTIDSCEIGAGDPERSGVGSAYFRLFGQRCGAHHLSVSLDHVRRHHMKR